MGINYVKKEEKSSFFIAIYVGGGGYNENRINNYGVIKVDKKKTMIILAIVVLTMGIGYGAFSSQLKINGTASIESNWKVQFTKIEEVSKTSGVTVTSVPYASGTSATFNVDFKSPGDKIIYNITLANEGTLDAIINNINAREKGSDAIYFDITGIKKGDLLNKKTTKIITIEIGFSNSATKQPLDVENKLTLTVECVQNIGQSISSEELNIETPVLATVTGTNNLTLTNSVGRNLYNYKIYGNSIQNGTPSSDTPIEILSVGDESKNYWNLGDLSGDITASGSYSFTNLPIASSYTLSATITRGAKDNVTNPRITIQVHYTDGTKTVGQNFDYPAANGETKRISVTVDVTSGKTISKIDGWVFDYSGLTARDIKATQIQLELGSNATNYEPYGYKIPIKAVNDAKEEFVNVYLEEPLRKVGDISDYIDFENKEIVRNIAKIELKGNETWATYRSTTGENNYYNESSTAFYTYISGSKNNSVKLSDKFAFKDYDIWPASVKEKDEGISAGTNDTRLFLRINHTKTGALESDNSSQLVTKFKKWLSNNPVTIYYQLASPLQESISLPNVKTMDGSSTLSISTSVSPSKIEASYYKNNNE